MKASKRSLFEKAKIRGCAAWFGRPCGVSLLNVFSRRVRPSAGILKGTPFYLPVKDVLNKINHGRKNCNMKVQKMNTLRTMAVLVATFTLMTTTTHATALQVGINSSTMINSTVLAQYGRSFGSIVGDFFEAQQRAKEERQKRIILTIGAICIGILVIGVGFYYVGTKECPYCRERVDVGARVCKHCHKNL